MELDNNEIIIAKCSTGGISQFKERKKYKIIISETVYFGILMSVKAQHTL